MTVRRTGRLGQITDISVDPPDGHCVRWNATTKECEFRAPEGGTGGGPHAATHQNNGGDEISVAGLSGLLADPQTPAEHGHASEIAAAVSAHEAAGNPHPTYTTEAEAAAAASAAVATHAAAADPHPGYQRESEKGAANGYASLGADGLVPAGQLPAPGGGSDPWTKVVLASDFTTNGTANAVVPGLAFTPAANKRYAVQVLLLLRTATATVGPRPGFSWPTGTNDGGAYMQAPSSATAVLYRTWGARATQAVANTGVPDTTSSHLATGEAYFIMGASPSGTFGVTLASETSGTVVMIKAGSVLLYREV